MLRSYLALLVLAVFAPLVIATSTTVFDVQTGEQRQVSVLTGSGVRPTIGWTVLSSDHISITVAVKAVNLGWLGVGVASSDGLSGSLMKGGGAIVYRHGQISSPPIQEYMMLGTRQGEVVLFDATPLSSSDLTKCAGDFCQSEAQACLGQSLCVNAVRCAQNKATELAQNISGSTTISSSVTFFEECAQPLSNPADPDQIASLAALLNAGGCVVSSCSKKLIEKGFRESALNASSFTQDSVTSTLHILLNKHQIAGVPFDSKSTTFLVAFADRTPTNSFNVHSPNQRAYTSINLNSGLVERQPEPSWVIPHVALSVIGVGLFFPLSIFLRAVPLKSFSWLPLLFVFFALVFVSTGSVVVSSYRTEIDYSDPHIILSILSILFVTTYLLINLFQPVEKDTDARAWDRIALMGVKENQLEKDRTHECKLAFRLLFRLVEILAIGTIVGAFFTGIMSIQNSAVEVDPAYTIIAIVASCVLVISAVASLVLRAYFRRRAAAAAAKTENFSSTGTNGPAQSSTNPTYNGEVEGGGADTEVIPLILTWEKVSFYAKATRTGGEPKQILKNAIGCCSPRTLTAVLGPSGAGKSSLMEILAMRSRVPPSPESKIMINGSAAGSFRGIHRLMGFVPQQDVLHEYLTVLETLQFTSQLILPSEMSEQAKVDRMLRVVAQLGIGHILDTPIGGEYIRGVSGGERRRVSIALQMLKSPSILFLDEPTSGLDAHLALKLCKVLRDLANEGRTIFATIHQPSAACFELFDRVVLLSGGYTVYSGSRTGALQFLREAGRPVPKDWNPADWLLTVVDFARDERNMQNEGGQLVYKNDAATEDILRRKGIVSMDTRFKGATSAAAIDLDVSELRDNVRAYYQTVNPAKLREQPGVVEEIVSFALAKGLDALEKKLVGKYGVSILPYFTVKQSQNLEPCTWDELVTLITKFGSSPLSFDLVDRIRKAKDEARASMRRLNPTMNAKYFMERLDSTGTMSPALDAPKSRRKGPKGNSHDDEENNILDDSEYPQPFVDQIRLLSRRSISLVWRNPQALRFQALQNIVFGILLGALYSNVKFLKSSPFQQSIVMAIILAMVAFVTLSLGTQVAFNDRLVLEREMSDSMYSPIAHYVQRIVIGVPVAFFIAMCLILPAYFWIGLKADGSSFFFFCLVNAAVVFLFDSVVFALTLVVSDVNSAYALGNFYEALTIFFSGVFLPIYAMPVYFRWLYFLSPFSFAFGAVVVNEFQDTDNEFSIAVSGVVIRSQWPNLIIVFGMGVLWRLLGLVGIIRLFRRKRPGSLSWQKQNEANIMNTALTVVVKKMPLDPGV